jgi:hypothetical protein
MGLNPRTIVTPRHQRLYETSPVFRASVDTTAALLPLWLDGLAAHAEAVDRWSEAQTEMVMGDPRQLIPDLPAEFRRGVLETLPEPNGD